MKLNKQSSLFAEEGGNAVPNFKVVGLKAGKAKRGRVATTGLDGEQNHHNRCNGECH